MAYEIDPPTYVPPFVDSREEARSRLADQRAMKWRQRAAGLAAGLAASRGASGFGESFLAGLSGSLGGVERFATQEEERQAIRARGAAQEAERRATEAYRNEQLAIDRERLMIDRDKLNRPSEGQNIGAIPWYEALPDTDPRKAQYREDALRAPAGQDMTEFNLTPEALGLTARIFAQTGQTPSLGFGKASTTVRSKIINEAARRFPGVDPVSNKAELDRNRASLTNVSKIYDAASAWEQTAGRNADVMLSVLDKIPDTGMRFTNKAARAAKSQLGDPDMAAFNSARETIKVEYARLLSSPGVGNAVLSDQARKEVEEIIGGDLTRPQMRRALGVLKQDAKNRKRAYSSQIGEIKNRLKMNELGTAGQVAPSGDVEWVMDQNGNLVPK